MVVVVGLDQVELWILLIDQYMILMVVVEFGLYIEVVLVDIVILMEALEVLEDFGLVLHFHYYWIVGSASWCC